MSRAKGLLKRFMHELTKEELCSVPDELQAEIEELLAQSEPLSKEQYMKFFTDTYDSVNPITDFVRAIEKAHGIGVDDDS